MTVPAVDDLLSRPEEVWDPRGVRIVIWGAGFPPAGTVTVHEEILPTSGHRSALFVTGGALDSDRGQTREFPEVTGPGVGAGAAHARRD